MITLDTAKYQCRIEHDDEDELLQGYINASISYAQSFLGRTLYKTAVPSDDNNGLVFNDSVKQACLMLIGHWYAHREAVPDAEKRIETPFAVTQLLQPYRIMGV